MTSTTAHQTIQLGILPPMEPGLITTVEDLDAFLDRVMGFHDGIIKELHLLNHAYVGPELNMLDTQSATARLLVQRQWKDPSAVELTLYGVTRIHVHTDGWVDDSEAFFEDALLRLNIEGSEFVFQSAAYRDASPWMGPHARFGAQLPPSPPSPEVIRND